jgi:large subunit ribosomal protein L30
MERLRITLKRSPIGRPQKHRKILRSLGLRKPNQSVIHNNTPSIRGMLNKVSYMIDIEPLKDKEVGDAR